MFDNYRKGQIAMLKVQLRAAELDMLVALPTVEARYDLLLDDGTKIHRVQTKYAGAEGSGATGAVVVDLRKDTRGNKRTRTYKKSEIDAVLAYVPQIDAVLWIGPDLFDGAGALSFRFVPPKNSQSKGVRLVNDFIW